MQTEQLLCWSGMRDTEHITSGSNEEEVLQEKQLQRLLFLNFNGFLSSKLFYF